LHPVSKKAEEVPFGKALANLASAYFVWSTGTDDVAMTKSANPGHWVHEEEGDLDKCVEDHVSTPGSNCSVLIRGRIRGPAKMF